MRLADRIMLEGLFFEEYEHQSYTPDHDYVRFREIVLSRLREAQRFQIDNVVKFLPHYDAPEALDVAKAIPIMAPPFGITWMEYGGKHGRGIMVCSEDYEGSGADFAPLFKGRGNVEDTQDGWFVSIYSVDGSGFRVTISPQVICLILDRHGRLCDYIPLVSWNMDAEWEREEKLNIAGRNQVGLAAMFTMGFLHCKNVKTRDVPVGEFERRSFREKHKRPLLAFKTLEIEPMKQVLRKEGNIEANGLKKALHICRGHFATYDEKPLFGKVKGTFWVPQHVRGSAEHGTVQKDYSIKLPKDPK